MIWWFCQTAPGSMQREDRYSYLTPHAITREYGHGAPWSYLKPREMAESLRNIE